MGGPNHVLPTARSARFSSGLSVMDFLKRTTLATMTPAALRAIGPAAVTLATSEGLAAHGQSVQARLDQAEPLIAADLATGLAGPPPPGERMTANPRSGRPHRPRSRSTRAASPRPRPRSSRSARSPIFDLLEDNSFALTRDAPPKAPTTCIWASATGGW